MNWRKTNNRIRNKFFQIWILRECLCRVPGESSVTSCNQHSREVEHKFLRASVVARGSVTNSGLQEEHPKEHKHATPRVPLRYKDKTLEYCPWTLGSYRAQRHSDLFQSPVPAKACLPLLASLGGIVGALGFPWLDRTCANTANSAHPHRDHLSASFAFCIVLMSNWWVNRFCWVSVLRSLKLLVQYVDAGHVHETWPVWLGKGISDSLLILSHLNLKAVSRVLLFFQGTQLYCFAGTIFHFNSEI